MINKYQGKISWVIQVAWVKIRNKGKTTAYFFMLLVRSPDKGGFTGFPAFNAGTIRGRNIA